MKLRNITLLGALVGLFILILFWALGWLRLPFVKVDPFEAVPTNTPLILSITDYPSLQDSLAVSDYQQEFAQDYLIDKLQGDFDFFESLIPAEPQRKSFLDDTHILAVLQSSSARDFDFLYVFSRKEGTLPEQQLLASIRQNKRLTESTFQRQKIYQWRTTNPGKYRDMAFCFFNNLLLVAPYALLIEDAIDQLCTPKDNLLKNSGFKQLASSLNSANFKAFVGLHNLPEMLAPFVEQSQVGMVRQLEYTFSWIGFSGQPGRQTFHFSGATAIPKGHQLLANLASKNSGDIAQLANVLPDNTAVFTWLNFEDWSTFYRQEEDRHGEFEQYFLPWVGKDFAYVITEPFGEKLESEKFAVFQVADADLARHYLEKYIEEKGELKNFDYQTYRIRQVLAGNLLQPIFGERINGIHNPFYVQIGDYVIFSNARQSLEVWIDKYNVGQTMLRDSRFLQWQQQESAANGLFYIDPVNAVNLLNSFLKKEFRSRVSDLVAPYLKANQLAFSLQPSVQEGLIPTAAHFSFGEKRQQQTAIIWKTILSDTLLKAPQVCYNEGKKAYEIFAQDYHQNIFLLNQGGDLLWKRKLEEPILSEVFVIDYYQNGQNQYLFNTSNAVYLIDQAGKDISNFPKLLKSPATNGMLAVDFQNRKEYAYFLACANGNVYGFSQTGFPLPGWNPLDESLGQINRPFQHCVYNNQDYIFTLNKSAELKAFKRNGDRRFGKVKLEASMTGPFGFDVYNNAFRAVAADERGRLYILNGAGDLFHLNQQVGNNLEVKFCFSNVLGDPAKDYVCASEEDLSVYTYNKAGDFVAAMTYQYSTPQDSLFEVTLPGQNISMIGSYNSAFSQINLLKGNGQLYPDFPLAGSTAYEVVDLFQDQQKILVVANDESIYAYKLR